MSRLMDSLASDHANLIRLLDVLERQVALFDKARLPDYDIVRAIVDYCLIYPDAVHHPKEDLVLRKLRDRDPAAAARIGDLERAHATLAVQTQRMATAVDAVLQDAAMSRSTFATLVRDFLAAYREHIAMEESQLFPAARAALTATDWAELDAAATDPNDPLFGDAVEARFKPLIDEVFAHQNAHPNAHSNA